MLRNKTTQNNKSLLTMVCILTPGALIILG